MEPIELIVGLGNPGAKYANTRHNAGFWFVDRVASAAGATFRANSRLLGESCEASVDGRRVRLLKPTTYMNRSGQSIGATLAYYKIPIARLLVVHDEIDLPSGTIRLKDGGGHGGHNGLRDIVAHLSAKNFARLRIGVGHPGQRDEVIGHVLRRAGNSEQAEVDEAIKRGLDELPMIVRGELRGAMNVLNQRKQGAKSSPDEDAKQPKEN